jgi:hypothetical protein
MTTVIRLLKDGTRRVLIHWFCRAPGGAATAANALIPDGPKVAQGPVRGYIACQKARASLAPQKVGADSEPCTHSDDVRAVTCPDCIATKEFAEMMDVLAQLEDSGVQEGPNLWETRRKEGRQDNGPGSHETLRRTL